MGINIAVVDDMKQHRQPLIEMLRQVHFKVSLSIREFDSAEALLAEMTRNMRFQVVFLDIELEGLDGICAAKRILAADHLAIIVMVSSYPASYVSDVFSDRDIFQFLSKPFEPRKFELVMASVLQEMERRNYRFTIPIGKDDAISYMVRDMVSLEVTNHKINLLTTDGSFTFRETIQHLLDRLSPYGFVRVHNAYIVNLAHIRSFEEKEVLLDGGVSVPISRTYRTAAKDAYSNYIMGDEI